MLLNLFDDRMAADDCALTLTPHLRSQKRRGAAGDDVVESIEGVGCYLGVIGQFVQACWVK
jgi:hypothetical protein